MYHDDEYKIVEFEKYCHKCKYSQLKESEETCDECLSEPVNLHTNKPVNFVEK